VGGLLVGADIAGKSWRPIWSTCRSDWSCCWARIVPHTRSPHLIVAAALGGLVGIVVLLLIGGSGSGRAAAATAPASVILPRAGT
jgi:hypothetical protein